jgi:hypothetical protein
MHFIMSQDLFVIVCGLVALPLLIYVANGFMANFNKFFLLFLFILILILTNQLVINLGKMEIAYLTSQIALVGQAIVGYSSAFQQQLIAFDTFKIG